MDTLETILTRRSVRRFTNDPVPKEILQKILKAGMYAPSAVNEQPWQFIVITKREMLDTIPTLHPYAKMCLQAQAAIIPCGDLKLEKAEGYWVQDLSAATQNILLAARALDLGAVWLGVHPKEDLQSAIKKWLNLPENIQPFSIIPLGFTEQQQTMVDRFHEDRIHYNQW